MRALVKKLLKLLGREAMKTKRAIIRGEVNFIGNGFDFILEDN